MSSTPPSTDETIRPAETAHRLHTAQAVRVAWRRARAFTILSRAPVAGFLLAVWEWPAHLALVAKDGHRIHHWRTASMAVDDGNRTRRPAPVVAAAVAAVGTQIALVFGLGIALTLVLTPALPPTPAAVLGVFVAFSPTLLDFGSTAINRLVRHRESLAMNKRRIELAETGDAAVMSSLVRARGNNHKGEGATLLELTKSDWKARNAAVILYPANTRLVGFYAEYGAVIDRDAHQRMIYNYQPGTTTTAAPGHTGHFRLQPGTLMSARPAGK